jgi:hypothetical protein
LKFPEWLNVFGDTQTRGDCASEDTEAINFYSWLKFNELELFELCLHIKNEGRKTWQQVAKDKKMGSIKKGAPDYVFLTTPPFLLELKRADHTKSSWQENQLTFLKRAHDDGAFCCVALGCDGAIEAVKHYKNLRLKSG